MVFAYLNHTVMSAFVRRYKLQGNTDMPYSGLHHRRANFLLSSLRVKRSAVRGSNTRMVFPGEGYPPVDDLKAHAKGLWRLSHFPHVYDVKISFFPIRR
jgi:hypothetical protein